MDKSGMITLKNPRVWKQAKR